MMHSTVNVCLNLTRSLEPTKNWLLFHISLFHSAFGVRSSAGDRWDSDCGDHLHSVATDSEHFWWNGLISRKKYRKFRSFVHPNPSVFVSRWNDRTVSAPAPPPPPLAMSALSIALCNSLNETHWNTMTWYVYDYGLINQLFGLDDRDSQRQSGRSARFLRFVFSLVFFHFFPCFFFLSSPDKKSCDTTDDRDSRPCVLSPSRRGKKSSQVRSSLVKFVEMENHGAKLAMSIRCDAPETAPFDAVRAGEPIMSHGYRINNGDWPSYPKS